MTPESNNGINIDPTHLAKILNRMNLFGVQGSLILNFHVPKPAEPAPESYLEGGTPAPPRGPVFPTFGAYEPEPAAVSVRHVLRPCGSMALQKVVCDLRSISSTRD